MQHGTSVRLETFNNIPTMADSMEAPQLQKRASYNVDDMSFQKQEETKSPMSRAAPNRQNESDMVVFQEGINSEI